MREAPRIHIRGLEENICSALAPRPCAISRALEISPAIEVWIPMRMLPSFHAGISGAAGGSGRYSSAASKVRLLLWFSSVIPSVFPLERPELAPRRQTSRWRPGSSFESEGSETPSAARLCVILYFIGIGSRAQTRHACVTFSAFPPLRHSFACYDSFEIFLRRRGRQGVRHGSAKPLSAVRVRPAPPIPRPAARPGVSLNPPAATPPGRHHHLQRASRLR